LVAMVLLMVVTGYGREAAVGARATGE